MFSYITSSVGKKFVMALTGVALMFFITVHMIGNLQVFLGPDALNKYAAALQGMGPVLWVARLVLLGLLGTHVFLSILLQIENLMARPVRYKKSDTVVATLASRTMIYTGILLLAYLVYHLLHFTIQSLYPHFTSFTDPTGRRDVYHMVIVGFSKKGVTLFYLAAVALLATHVYHGASSFFQSLGLNNPKYHAFTRCVGPLFGILIFVGYAIVPVAVLLKWIY